MRRDTAAREIEPATRDERTRKDEGSNRGNEAGEECVEGEGADEHAVKELRNAGQENVEQVSIDDLELGGHGLVRGVQLAKHILHANLLILLRLLRVNTKDR